MARATTVSLDPVACCATVRADTLTEADAELLARSFAALADPIRLRMLSVVASAGGEEVCACDLVSLSGRSQPTVSHHMKILVDAGLVSRTSAACGCGTGSCPRGLDALRTVLG